MAGKPIGTIFAELDLDTTKFTRAQQTILKEAGVVTLGVEKNYKTLGIKSATMFDAMRAQAENAYLGIKNSSRATADDIVRAEKAKSERIKQLNNEQFGHTESLMTKMKNNWFAVTAAIAATGVAVAGVKKLIDAASDLEESQNKVNVIFGQSATAINDWAAGSVNAFGLSRQAALDAAGTMGNMWQQLGAGTKVAVDNSMAMTELAADLASFHNVAGGANEVLMSMQSAFRGEYDALQKYIPTINAAAVEQEALAQTGKKAAGDLTALEKATAAQTIITREAGAAVGDFQRTSDGYANSARRMEAGIDDLQATIGRLLLPVVAEVVNKTADWVVNNENLINQRVGEWVDNTTAAVKAMVDLYDRMPDGVIGTAGVGVVGRILLGSWGAAGAATILATHASNLWDLYNAAKAMVDVEDEAQSKLQEKYEKIGQEIAQLEASLENPSWWYNFWKGPGEHDEAQQKLETLRAEYNALAAEIEGVTSAAEKSGQAMGDSADEAVNLIVKSLDEQYAATNSTYEKIGQAAIKQNAADVKSFEEASKKRLAQFKSEANELQRIREQFSDKYQKLILDDYDYQVLQLKKEVDEFRRAGVDKERLAEYYMQRLGDLQNKHLDVVEGSNNAQYESELTKWQLIDQASMAGTEEAIKRYEQMTGEAEATAAEQADAYAKLYADIGDTSQESYQHKVGLLDAEYEKLKQVLGDSELLQAAYAERKKELDWEMRLSTDDFLGGMLVAWEQYEDSKKTLAEQGAQFFADTHAAMRDTASDIFFDALTGDLKDLGDYAEAVWQSIARSFADMAAQMVADYAMSGLMDLLKPSSSGGGLVSGILGAAGDLGGTLMDVGSDALDWLADLWPFAQGAWEITEDQIAKLHEGEMVIPAEFADYVRALIGASGSAMGWQQSYTGPPAGTGGEAGWAAIQYYEQLLAQYQAGFGGPDIAGMVDPAVGGADASAYWAAYNAGYFAPGGTTGVSSAFGGLTSSMSPGGMGAYAGGATDSSYAEQVMTQAAIYGFASGTLPVIVAGLSYGVPLGDVLSIALEAGVQSAINGMVGMGPTNLAGFDSAYSKIGAYIGTMMGSELGPLAGVAGFAGAVAGEGIADLLGVRRYEPALDYLEDSMGWLSAHYAIGADPGSGVGWWGAEGNLPGMPSDYWGGGGVETGGWSTGGSYAGVDTYGGANIYARGGWATGPESGYQATLHGTEYVLNQDQIKAIREVVGGDRSKRPMKIVVQLGNEQFNAHIRHQSEDIILAHALREQRGRRDTSGATPGRVYK